MLICLAAADLRWAAARQMTCAELTVVLLRSEEDLLQKFALPAAVFPTLLAQWRTLEPSERLRIATIFHHLPALPLGRKIWQRSVPTGEQSVLRVLGLIIKERGLIDNLLFKALLSPQQVTLDEARTLHLLFYQKWWFAGPLGVLKFSANQHLDVIISKVINVIGLQSSGNLPRQLWRLLGQDRLGKSLWQRQFYLYRFWEILQAVPWRSETSIDWENIARSLEDVLSRMPPSAEPWQHQELSSILWLIQHRLDQGGGPAALTLSMLKRQSPKWPAHLQIWGQQNTRPALMTIIELYLIGIIIEKILAQVVSPAEDYQYQDSASIPILPPPNDRGIAQALANDPMEILMQQFNQGTINRQQFQEQAAQLIRHPQGLRF